MPRCTNCGTHVTPRFARVFGDNHDTVHNCVDCVPNADLERGDGTSTADAGAGRATGWDQ